MPLHPVTTEEIDSWRKDILGRNTRYTICEAIREVYAKENNGDLKELLLVIYAYAKRMDKKLREYNGDYDQGWWGLTPMTPVAKIFQQHTVGQTYEELQAFVDWLRPREPKVILEIGFYRGGTARVWQTLEPEIQVEVDFEFKPQDMFPGFIPITGDSTHESTVEAVTDALGGRKVDFLFIDGNHSLECAGKDLKNYGPMVRKSGVIAFHDVFLTRPGAEVHALWEQLRSHHNTLSFQVDGGPGIGVMVQS